MRNPFSAMFQDMSQKALRLFIITMASFVMASMADGDIIAVCPAGCRCNTLTSYVDSLAVKCSYTDMSYVPVMLNFIVVHSLDISYNRITILRNGTFSNYSRLATLILSYNEVSDIEREAFAGLLMLRDIDLSYNKLKSFNPEIFSSNQVLEQVSLKGNPLLNLSPDSPILISSSLTHLDLSSCSITKFHPKFFSGLLKLRFLDISSNDLQTISEHTLEELSNLRELVQENNPWDSNFDVIKVTECIKLRWKDYPVQNLVNCMEGGKYGLSWKMAGGNRSSSEFLIVDSEIKTDKTIDLSTTSVDFPLPVRPVPHTPQRDVETEVATDSEQRSAKESEKRDQASLHTNGVFVIVIVCIVLFVSLVCYFVYRYIVNRRPHYLALFIPQFTTDLKK